MRQMLALATLAFVIAASSLYLLRIGSHAEHPIASCMKVFGSERNACMRATMLALLRQRGMDAALKELDFVASNKEYSISCHSAAHAIGAAAYTLSQEGMRFDFSPEMDSCSFGFFHGYVVEMRTVEGSLKSAMKLCEGGGLSPLTTDDFPEGECYHGMGNAIVNNSQYGWDDPAAILKDSQKTCEGAATSSATYLRCMGGVYNTISNAYQYAGKLNRDTLPSSLCDLIQDPTKPICESYIWGGYFANTPVAEIVRDMPESLPKELRLAIIQNRMLAAAKATSIAPEDVPPTCSALPDIYRAPCISGYAGGLIQLWNPPMPPARAYDFCAISGITDAERESCIGAALSKLAGYVHGDELANTCSNLPAPVKPICGRLAADEALKAHAPLTDPNIVRNDYF